MYRHLMVPLDDSPLAAEVVRQAVALAKRLDARITFFHVNEDATTSVSALESVMFPAELDDSLEIQAKKILAAAGDIARNSGVEHTSLSIVSDRPYEAILRAAKAEGCDLIVMASHGRKGLRSLLLGSQTQHLLQNTTLPVLVAAVPNEEATEATE